MRGNIKTDSYFEGLYKHNDEELAHYKELVDRAYSLRGENDKGVRNGYSILNSIYQNRINLMYTIGKNACELRDTFDELLYYYEKIWEPENSYFELIKVASLAVLLDVNSKDDNMKRLLVKISNRGYSDYLLDWLLSNIDSTWEGKCTNFAWSNTYESLKEVIESEESNKAVVCLNKYLEDEWYDIHAECPWYDSHKSEKKYYYGYWSFESGAIAKGLCLQDEKLKDTNYYPYDLVHFV